MLVRISTLFCAQAHLTIFTVKVCAIVSCWGLTHVHYASKRFTVQRTFTTELKLLIHLVLQLTKNMSFTMHFYQVGYRYLVLARICPRTRSAFCACCPPLTPPCSSVVHLTPAAGYLGGAENGAPVQELVLYTAGAGGGAPVQELAILGGAG